MNKGWKIKGGLRGAPLARCDQWNYPVPPFEGGELDDSEVENASKEIFGEWNFSGKLAREMRK
jgi:hypothetical protein